MGFLRFLLAAAVLLGHAPDGIIPKPLWGPLAVETFFLISGFYMQLIIGDYSASGAGWKRKFYMSRALRIYPLYYVTLAATLVFIGWTGLSANHTKLFTSGQPSTILAFVFSSLFIFGQDVLRFATFNPGDGLFHFGNAPEMRDFWAEGFAWLGQGWSLSLELMFYLLVPFLLLRKTHFVVIVALISFLVKLVILKSELKWSEPDWRWAFFPAELYLFLVGSLACRYAMRTKQKIKNAGRMYSLLLAGYTLYAFYYPYLPLTHAASNHVFIIATALLLPILFRVSKDNRWDRKLGEYSYPIYLVHILAIIALDYAGLPKEYIGAAALGLSVAVAAPLIRWVDAPLSRFRHRQLKAV